MAAFQAGEFVDVLAARYGIHRWTVLNHLKQHNVKRRRSRLSAVDIDKVVRLYGEGWTLEALAQELRVGASTVRRALVRSGVELRSRGM